ncbi:uncharacterized protein LOC110722368 [Chenopodium quinoa]|uniref:uncharacterized protein LOC110722368 n=1 Tax=Chenopodium quinoa TaxID=63459 RepID=UPI000B788646|nr:uncharacterized protein LOC110722368 [Chenopodium quinoa]XP_021757338.1 uncharacterized protein LOC110722368 [Chenopodium quinoa]XP_021757341.1 uncharacterized protein LOC110722368 [Chenopodium quinoa]XP_021757348.1 uncharacterized protein LOC110722368 [Chenopodium quinoa]
MSWLMVTCPRNSISMECIFSDPCPEVYIAEQRVAKKACFFIASVCNVEIVDANYGAAAKISGECYLIREKYMVLKGHLECLESSSKQIDSVNGLGTAVCVTPTDEENQIPVLAHPPSLPSKRRIDRSEPSTSGVGMQIPDSLVAGLSDLETVYKCARVE